MSVPPLSSLGSSFPEPQAFAPGLIIKTSTDQDLYLIDPEGYRRLIPPKAIKGLFGDATLKVSVNDQLPFVKSGPPISADAYLARVPAPGIAIFFADKPYPGSTTFRFRWIVNPDVLTRYQFNLNVVEGVALDTLNPNIDPRFWV